ncbi:MAG: S-methyl-5'-thioadenosine phosphorylase [Acidobacteriota bacterium]|nr:MAG: S-methyl-5'-thioadenosine phosphorylase [Acidobacteriota bacterium]
MTSSRPAARVGVLGGSGLYALEKLSEWRECDVTTPFGEPSDRIIIGMLGDVSVAFLARHGREHRLMPTEINYRANIYAMKTLGVEFLLSASAVGSLREDIAPLDVLVPDQFIDRTRHRADTFFGDGVVAHVSMAEPVCRQLAASSAAAAKQAGARVHEGGTYVCMEGPQFSTRAESHMYRSWGAAVIGMTNLQEARLAREAEICYATLALVTDYDCWRDDEDHVTVETVVERLKTNAERARDAVSALAQNLPAQRKCPCARALDHAIITPRSAMPAETIERLAPIVGRVLGGGAGD